MGTGTRVPRFPIDLELIHLGTDVIPWTPFPTVQREVPLALNSLALLPFEKGFPGFLPGLFGSVDGRFLDLLDVENILFPARSQFVPDQVFPRDDISRGVSVEQGVDTVFPCFVERHAADLLKDIDSIGRHADLKPGFCIPEIFSGKSAKGCAILA